MRRVLGFVEALLSPVVIVAAYYFLAILVTSALSLTSVRATIAANLIVVAAFVACSFVRKGGAKPSKPVSRLTNMDALVGVGLLVAVWFVGQMAAAVVNSMTADAAFQTYQANTASDTQAAVLLLFLLAPFAEEILMRRCAYRVWRDRVNPWFALLASSALFAMMHGTLVHAVPTFLMGFLAAVVYERTGNVAYPIGFHMAYNVMSLLLGGMSVPDIFGTPLFAFGGSAVCIALMVVIYGNLIGGNGNGKAKGLRQEADHIPGASEEDAGGQGEGQEATGEGGSIRRVRASDEPAPCAHPTRAAGCGKDGFQA